MTSGVASGVRSTGRSSGALVAIYFVIFISELPFQALFPLLPSYAADFHLSKSALGLLVAAVPIGALVTGIPIGGLAQRFGPRLLMLAAVVGLAATSVAQAIAPEYWSLLAARAAFGAVHGGVWIAAPALTVAASEGRRRGGATAGAVAVAATGSMVAPAVAGFVAQRLGLRAPFFFAAVLAALASVAWLSLRRGRDRPTAAPTRVSASRMAASSVVRAAVGATVVAALIGNGVGLLISLQLGRNGLSSTSIGLVFAAAAAGLLLTSVVVTALGTRAMRPGVVGLATLILGVSMLSLIAAQGNPTLVVFMVVKSMLFGVMYTIAYPLAAGAGGEHGTAALALVSVAWAGGALAGPLFAGLFASRFGSGLTYGVFALLTVSFGVAILVDQARSRLSLPAVQT